MEDTDEIPATVVTDEILDTVVTEADVEMVTGEVAAIAITAEERVMVEVARVMEAKATRIRVHY
jgi:hypothetical protein